MYDVLKYNEINMYVYVIYILFSRD